MAQSQGSNREPNPIPPRPAGAPPAPKVIDENARRLREWGPKIQIVTRRPREGSGS
jgi:hypothetical protein